MTFDPALLANGAIALYLLTLCASLFAARTASARMQLPWHSRVWIALALMMVIFIASRLLGLEEGLREGLRDMLRSGGNYGGRRDFQSIIAGSIIMLTACGVMFAIFRAAQRIRGRRSLVALSGAVAGVALAFLVTIRIISLHVLDWFLYGPLKLNWIGDIGLSAAILALALYYVKLVRDRTRPQTHR